MKKGFLFLLWLMISVVLASCSLTAIDGGKDTPVPTAENTSEPKGYAADPGNESEQDSNDPEIDWDRIRAGDEEYIKGIIEERAIEVLTAISNNDFGKLSGAVHPEKGVRFTPYGYVDAERDLVFSADEIKSMASDSRIYMWGNYDGIGDPIELSFRDYFSRFVYDADFLEAEQTGYNKILGQGNSINNSFEFYEDSIIVEYHFPGIDPKYEGMDWRSLRLVFEEAGDTWYLVGIIHDEWTI
ncbi:MAG: hypothetical protein GX027_07950 [Clostridiaceae bacterium]|jgi:hypothetical protein|nr:hypothetical protein [Clostridiaceae bacterium]